MINEKYPDGQSKPLGLYEWQVKHNMHDEEPLFEFAAQQFSLLAQLPGYIVAMANERALAAIEHQNHMSALRKAEVTIKDAQQKLDDLLTRAERLLYHLHEIETKLPDLAKNIVGNIDYGILAKPLHDRVKVICEQLPLKELALKVQILKNAEIEIENVSLKMDNVATTLANVNNTKREMIIASAGGAIGTALLIFTLYLFVCLSHLGEKGGLATNTNAVVLPSVTDPQDQFGSLRDLNYTLKGEPFVSNAKTYVELEHPENH